jgi:hypothetical protein
MSQKSILPVLASCPVCHYGLAAPFFDGGQQPLATLGWPNSSEVAKSMTPLALDYVQCPRCTHIWNRSFSYDAIPYTNNPNRMFNKGGIWQGHLKDTRDVLLSQLSINPTIIDIGCGEGHFVRGLSEALNGKGHFLGFDPNSTTESGVGLEFHARYFNPLVDISAFTPDLLIMRHVLEHLLDPAAFIEQLAWGVSQINKKVLFFAEMPCVDRALDSKRLVDFFYEHPSQFTSKSFMVLMEHGGNILHLEQGYDGEVIYALVELKTPEKYRSVAINSSKFFEQAIQSQNGIRGQLKELIDAGNKIAIWGGTGKAAAFIHYFDADAKNFPLVVDSDLDKVGTFVPKTGQKIEYRDILKTQMIDIVIIPPQWRAKDIVQEMKRENIYPKQILIEHNGRLVDFHHEPHPYRN